MKSEDLIAAIECQPEEALACLGAAAGQVSPSAVAVHMSMVVSEGFRLDCVPEPKMPGALL
jgi:hypothetical protein